MLLPASASAEGGNSIAAGPVVTFGQLETGNTASGEPFGSYIVKSFWNLPVRAGDEITIDWEAKRGTRIIVFAPGTTDFTISSAHSVHK
jgi:hypothetical protein